MLDEELHHQGRLVVGELQVHRRLGAQEGGAEIADRRQFAAQDHPAIRRIHLLAPGGIMLRLFVDGNPFTEPPRHPVGGQAQRYDVAELVPQHRLPVEGRGGSRTVGCDDLAEADAEKTLHRGHAERANREILLIREQLHRDRAVRLESVLLAELRSGLLEQLDDLVAVDRRLARVHLDEQAVRRQGPER